MSAALADLLRPFTEGKSEVELDCGACEVGAALAALWSKYPGVRDRVVTEVGEVRQHVNVFVGDESIRFLDGLKTPVPERGQVHIVPAVSGG